MSSRNDIIVRMRLAGEDFERDFRIKMEDITQIAEEKSREAGRKSGGTFADGFLKSAGIAGLGTAIGVAISKAAALGDQITSLGRQFNMGAEEIQAWQYAASKAGVSSEQFTGALGNLTQKIGEANAGNAKAQQAFANLGLSFRTASGEARATDKVMEDLARRIAAIEDPAERVRVGQKLLGDQFKTLYPLLLEAADGTDKLKQELGAMGAMLSEEEIKNLEKTNADIERMKRVLSIRVASIVAENADAILGMADAFATLTGAVVKFGNEYPRVAGMLGGAAVGGRVGGPWGAVAGGVGGLVLGEGMARNQADANMDVKFRLEQLRTAQQRFEASRRGTVDRTNDPIAKRAQAELQRQTNLLNQAMSQARASAAGSGTSELLEAPRVTSGGAKPKKGSTKKTPEEIEAERAARDAIRREEQFRDAIARTLRAQQDSAEVERVRAEQGEVAAAGAEARLAFERQNPLAIYDTVEALGVALGITRELTAAEKERFQSYIESARVAKQGLVDAAEAQANAKIRKDDKREQEEAARKAKILRDRYEAEMERAIFDLAGIYETAFRGGTKGFLDLMRSEGTRIIAEIAAQWTLAMISKQPFSFSGALGWSMQESPLGSIFRGREAIGGLGGMRGAANDNGIVGMPGLTGGAGSMAMAGINSLGITARNGKLTTPQMRAAKLEQAAFSLALGSIASQLVPGGNGLGGQIGGMAGSVGGMALGGKIAALGSFGGPVGAVAGAIIGTLLGGILDGGIGPKRGQVTIGNAGGQLGIIGQTGKSDLRGQAASGANSLLDALNRIAGQIGATVDPSRGSVSLGIRDGDFRVDPTGRGATRVKGGAIDFGKDEQAAIRFALTDLIRDGVLTGISQASQNLLARAGSDLEKQLEKVMMIEAVPRLLRERLDPLGAAMDELFDKFKFLADAMREAGASAEQVAEAQRLWELEKADTIASVGAASQTLKDFLASLNAGSNSPLSLREQRLEAERQFEPFLAQLTKAEQARAEVERLRASGATAEQLQAAELAARTAAAAIDQRGFTEASQLLLSISRQSNASTGSFFSDFDRVKALTGQAMGFIDSATAASTEGRDPFGREIAQNTGDMAAILAEHTKLLQALNDNTAGGGASSGGGGGGYLADGRLFVSAL